MNKQSVYLEHYMFDHHNREGVHTAYSDTFEVTDEQLALMELIVYTRDHTSDYSTRLNAKRALNHMYNNYEALAPYMFDAEEQTIEKEDVLKMSRYDIEYILETAQINVPCQFDHYDNADGNIHMYQQTGVVEIHRGYSPHEETKGEKEDSFFRAFADEMLNTFNEGYVDYQQNFDCPYDHNTPKHGAWVAGYAKAHQESQH